MTPEERIILGAYWELMQREAEGRFGRGPSAVRLAKYIREFGEVPKADPSRKETLLKLKDVVANRLFRAKTDKDRSSEEQWLNGFYDLLSEFMKSDP